MVNSMTGFAALTGAHGGKTWAWEIRSVNARGLDLRLRLPDGAQELEPRLRKALTHRLARGNVTLGLRIANDPVAAGAALDPGQLASVLAALKTVETAAGSHDLHLTASSAAEILSLRGVMDSTGGGSGLAPDLMARMAEDIGPLVDSFAAARADEGAALARVLGQQIAQISNLVSAARASIGDRHQRMRETLKANVARLLEASAGIDQDRLSQELALLAVKADVAEELDRLEAHIAAARELLAEDGPIGRKFDFLTQEFNREANTLCSKSNDAALTRIGLDLKSVIDQMREQVQNVE